MSRIVFGWFVFTVLLAVSCSTTKTAENRSNDQKVINGDGTTTVKGLQMGIPLEDYLRQVAGIVVSGEGVNAEVRIRGAVNSLNTNTSPLFVINGQAVSNNFSDIYSLVPVYDIARVSVLKGPSATGPYGVRGANGVIEIFTKK